MILSPALAEALLFQPSRGDPGPPPILEGIAGEAIELRTSDGVKIQAWWYPSEGPQSSEEAGPPRPSPAILFLHGNAGDISHRTTMASGFLRERLSVLLLEYRGYGGSEGSPSEEGLAADAVAGYEFLLERQGDARGIVVLGRSMGGAVAARLAAEMPVAGVILESTFTSLYAMARILYPFLPAFLLRRLGGRFDARERVGKVHAPVLVVHGTEDEIVPIEMGKELFRVATSSHPQWLEVPGAGHNDVFWVGGEEYFKTLGAFVRECTRGEPPEGRPAPVPELSDP